MFYRLPEWRTVADDEDDVEVKYDYDNLLRLHVHHVPCIVTLNKVILSVVICICICESIF